MPWVSSSYLRFWRKRRASAVPAVSTSSNPIPPARKPFANRNKETQRSSGPNQQTHESVWSAEFNECLCVLRTWHRSLLFQPLTLYRCWRSLGRSSVGYCGRYWCCLRWSSSGQGTRRERDAWRTCVTTVRMWRNLSRLTYLCYNNENVDEVTTCWRCNTIHTVLRAVVAKCRRTRISAAHKEQNPMYRSIERTKIGTGDKSHRGHVICRISSRLHGALSHSPVHRSI